MTNKRPEPDSNLALSVLTCWGLVKWSETAERKKPELSNFYLVPATQQALC